MSQLAIHRNCGFHKAQAKFRNYSCKFKVHIPWLMTFPECFVMTIPLRFRDHHHAECLVKNRLFFYLCLLTGPGLVTIGLSLNHNKNAVLDNVYIGDISKNSVLTHVLLFLLNSITDSVGLQCVLERAHDIPLYKGGIKNDTFCTTN